MILGMLLIVVGMIFHQSSWFKTMASYVGLSADGKVKHDMDEVAILFRNVMIYMGGFMILGELLADYLQVHVVGTIFLFGALISGVGYFVFVVKQNYNDQ